MGGVASGPSDGRTDAGWMPSSSYIAEALRGVSSSYDDSRPFHRHVHLINGRAGAAKVYTPELVAGVLKALQLQMQEEGHISTMEVTSRGPAPVEAIITDCPLLCYRYDVIRGYLPPHRADAAS